METTKKPAARCETCATPLYNGQEVIEGGVTHEVTAEGVRSRRTFYCSQGCADR
jgi:hypothetical protein